ncbi:MAG: MBOAT family protein, partial [Candidatus Aminicenantes bacterium]|nr:MBOAT family protein [Candidatus Aminicenantes bacterium]
RGHIAAQRDFVRVALYVSFFPEIPAGPIDRAAALLPQFLEKLTIDFTRVAQGLQSIGWGLFKKLVIADRLAKLVNAVYDQPAQHHGPVIGLAAIFYGFQVYCDFSGYSDIAIGLGRILGVRLMENFKRPFLAESIPDFWRRWHISLSSWLRDYLFLPISYSLMRRLDKNKTLAKMADRWAYVGSVLCTMLLCGLWHGANWTFAAWGLLHGLLLVVSFVAKKARNRTVRFLHLKKFPLLLRGGRILFTFALVSFSWLFFRARSIKETFKMIAGLFSAAPAAGAGKAGSAALPVGLSRPEFIIAVAAIVFLLIVELLLEKKDEPIHLLLSGRPVWLRWAVYYLVIFSILLFGIYEQQAFIYGRF